MKLYLFDTYDDNATINKKLQNKVTYDIKLKGDCSVLYPVITLQSENLILNNYAYIPEFKRYYFINNITLVNKVIYTLELSCDVLETYKKDILNSTVKVSPSYKSNPDFSDNIKTTSVLSSNIYYSDVELTKETSNILVAINTKR